MAQVPRAFRQAVRHIALVLALTAYLPLPSNGWTLRSPLAGDLLGVLAYAYGDTDAGATTGGVCEQFGNNRPTRARHLAVGSY